LASSEQANSLINTIKGMYNADNVAGMAKFGINPHNNYGVKLETLRGMAKETGKNHDLALKLWGSGIHDARILACLIDDPQASTSGQVDEWANDFDSWDVCDACCTHLFQNLPFAYEKIIEWSENKVVYVKRAGFSLMARLAVSDKKAPDEKLEQFLPIIIRESSDDRNFVKKAVNWALRQIGKRNVHLNTLALQTAGQIQAQDTRSAKWIASDAIRELTDEKIQRRFKK
jgi:3-methyladenine DNA glycosylase AlkD